MKLTPAETAKRSRNKPKKFSESFRIAEVEGSIPFESTKRGPDEPGNDLFRWSCVRSVPAVAEKAVKKKRHPALWPGAFSYACFVAAASRRSGSIISSMVHPKT